MAIVQDVSFNKGLALSKLSREQQDKISKAKRFAGQETVKHILLKQTLQHQQQQMGQRQISAQRSQALALMCRIYVGSINFELNEDTIRAAFVPFGPVKSCDISWDPVTQKHKGFAFIEYEMPESAQLALDQMNSVILGGRNVKVGRPSNMPQALPIIQQITSEAGKYHRIFIASIHPDITEGDIKSVFEAFGKIVCCELGKDSSSPLKHRGFGFIEFETSQSAQDAIASMNLFDLGGQYLRVGKAMTPPAHIMEQVIPSATGVASGSLPTKSAVAAAAVTAKIQQMDMAVNVKSSTISHQQTLQVAPPPPIPLMQLNVPLPFIQNSSQPPNSSVPPGSLVTHPPIFNSMTIPSEAPHIPIVGIPSPKDETRIQAASRSMFDSISRKSESKVIVLRNMVGPEDLDDDLESEVTEECCRYGKVVRVIIFQEQQGVEENAAVIVKIFVEFSLLNEAANAANSLNNRWFGGRTVICEIYSQEQFNSQDYSG